MARKPQNNTSDMRSAAFALLARGWSVIPVEARGKRPIVPWLEYQSRLATEKEVEAWFGGRRNPNLGIVTGALSNLVVLDIDAHPSGRRYQWVPRRSPQEMELAALPAWLLRFVRRSGSRAGHPLAHWRQLVREGVDEGSRNSALASLAGHLLRQGVDPKVALDLLLAWNRVHCRPPLADDEVAQVVDSIAQLHEQKERRSRSSAK